MLARILFDFTRDCLLREEDGLAKVIALEDAVILHLIGAST